MKKVNFDMIKNNVSEQSKKQYQQIDHHEIMCYLLKETFRNIKRDGLYVTKETVDEHFKNKKTIIGHGQFIKQIKDSVYAEAWWFFVVFLLFIRKNKMSDNTYGSVILHVESWNFFLLL